MDYYFSIVMAVYRVEDYLREAIDSVIAQDIGFERIQLILVDDGSPDSSGAICDEYAARYPENIFVIHKENGGVSSARNAGLEQIQGRYTNFLDSDDKLPPNALSAIYRFFESHQAETDVVSIPIFYFEGRSSEHNLNYKFSRGKRVIDLTQEWDAPQLHVSSSFFRSDALQGMAFDTRLRYAEDAKFLQQVLVKKATLGVLPETRYLYRIRSGSSESAMQKANRDAGNFTAKLKFFDLEILQLCRKSGHAIPKFIQATVMYDLQWYFLLPELPAVLSNDAQKEFLNDLCTALKEIDNDVILAARNIVIAYKLFALRMKYGTRPVLEDVGGALYLTYDGSPIFSLSAVKPLIEFISYEQDHFSVSGTITIIPLSEVTQVLVMELDGTTCDCDVVFKDTRISLGESIAERYVFHFNVPLTPGRHTHFLRLGYRVKDQVSWVKKYAFGPFSGLCEWYSSSYYIREKWCVQCKEGLCFTYTHAFVRIQKELRFLWALTTGQNHRARSAVLNRLAYWLLRLIKRRPLWLISDRETHAGDNGEALFRYLIANHPEIDARFALLKDSPDYPSLAHTGKVVPADSLKRRMLYLVSDYVISSHAEWLDYRPFAPKDAPYRDIMADRRFVFLQHGITQNDVSDWLKKSNKNIFGFITAARPEYMSIVNGHYGYSSKEVWLTGFPRFDRIMGSQDPMQITIMPTWRKYLMGPPNDKTLMRELIPQFTSSHFFTFYNELLNSERLLHAADKYGYTLAFFPHPNLQPHISLFNINDAVIALGAETAYRDVYAKSALLVTDYSSAVFDFAYMRRPIVYAHFDKQEFFSGDHVCSEGYFDYERDGFGEVEYDLEHTIDRIIEYMENGCQMKEKYRARADRFFAFNDRNNCQRVYDKLIEAGETADN